MIERIAKRSWEGREFQDLARMYSEDSNQDSGGDWGPDRPAHVEWNY